MSSSAGKRSQLRASGHGCPWQASTGAQLSLTATHRLRQGWIKLGKIISKDFKYCICNKIENKSTQETLGKKEKNLRVKADRCNDGAEECLGLRVAASLQQGSPVLRARHHLTFKVAVA